MLKKFFSRCLLLAFVVISSIGGFLAQAQELSAEQIVKNTAIRQKAAQGDAEAQWLTGRFYDLGLYGHEKNAAEALQWYRKAAEQGNASAQLDLGICYSKGKGLEKDFAVAVKWFRKSAEQGNPTAQSNLARHYAIGEGVEGNMLEAAKWLHESAAQGYAEAQSALGIFYFNGLGVVKSAPQAYKWSLLAAAQGHDEAKQRVAALEQRITPAQRAEGQRLAAEWQAAFEKREAAKK